MYSSLTMIHTVFLCVANLMCYFMEVSSNWNDTPPFVKAMWRMRLWFKIHRVCVITNLKKREEMSYDYVQVYRKKYFGPWSNYWVAPTVTSQLQLLCHFGEKLVFIMYWFNLINGKLLLFGGVAYLYSYKHHLLVLTT